MITAVRSPGQIRFFFQSKSESASPIERNRPMRVLAPLPIEDAVAGRPELKRQHSDAQLMITARLCDFLMLRNLRKGRFSGISFLASLEFQLI